MEDIEEDYNFNIPLELTEIFRTPTPKLEEWSAKVLVGWEDVKVVDQYAYPDDWVNHKGDKFFLTLHGAPNPKLIYGSYQEFKRYWGILRNKYPVFYPIES